MKHKCHICGGESFTWGNVDARGNFTSFRDMPRLLEVFELRFTTKKQKPIVSRMCDQCSNLQAFVIPREDWRDFVERYR